MIKKKHLCVLFLFSAMLMQAQNINLEFPYFEGQTYEFTIFQGEKRVNLKADTIPKGGKVQLVIPKEYAGYKGAATWYITNSYTGGGLDLIINNEDFSVSCLDSIPTEQNIIYKNTTENIFDKTNYKKQQALFEKHDAMLSTLKAYDENTKLHIMASEEYNSIISQFEVYSETLSKSPLYAAKFRQIVNLTMGIGTIIAFDENKKANNMNGFIANELDFELLYTSNLWNGVITNWIQMQTIVLRDDRGMIDNINNILGRIKSNKVFTDFTEILTRELTKIGKDEIITAITPTVKNRVKLLHFNGVLSVYKINILDKAPDLIIDNNINQTEKNKGTKVIKTNKLQSKYTLLLFYQTDCGHCKSSIEAIKSNYNDLQKKGIQIISLSADEDVQHFKEASDNFPWKYKYCDLKGFNSVNFQNYGIAGTPTMYLLDHKGIIIKKFATFEELLKMKF